MGARVQMAFLTLFEERSIHRFPGGFRKAIFSSHTALSNLFSIKAESL
jgi:hypothetical protein